MKYLVYCAVACFLSACGNPGGISDVEYAKYKELGAPKILFSCSTPNLRSVQELTEMKDKGMEKVYACGSLKGTEEDKIACVKKVSDAVALAMKEELPPNIQIGYRAGIGVAATYNKILQDGKNLCGGKFSIIEKSE